MKKIILISCLLLIGIIAYSQGKNTQYQSDTIFYHIETNDGNSYTGEIIKEDKTKIWFQTTNIGDIVITKTDVKKMFALQKEKIKKGKYWLDNPQATRYFFSPNGYGLKSGEGYYQNVWVLVNSFAVGLTDYISIGGGIVPLFFFGGASTPVWFTAKASIPIKSDKFSMGAGVLGGTVLGEEETSFGILYGIATAGDKNNNISLGVGYGYAGSDWAKSPMINLNFMYRTGAKGYFISENYYIQAGDESLLLLSAGGRYIIKDAGLDYGLVMPIMSGMDGFFAIPWLGITIPFGNKKKVK